MSRVPFGWPGVLFLAVGGLACSSSSRADGADEPTQRALDEAPTATGIDPRNAEYVLSGRPVRLVDGVSETEPAPGSAASVVTRYFGNEARNDLDGDGREDVVFLLTQEMGGSGTFYYVVAAVRRDDRYRGSHGVMLGDRIAPQSTEIRPDGVIVVSYADRGRGESFTAAPSVGKTIWLKLDPETLQFGEVAQDFEGEADPARMRLDMKTWSWVRTTYGDGASVEPRRAGVFTLTFGADGVFSATTDCNSVAGRYVLSGAELRFGDMAATQMHCEGAQQTAFTTQLAEASAYRFTSRGELVLTLRADGATMTFR